MRRNARIFRKSHKNLLDRCKLILAVLFLFGFNLKAFKFFNKYRYLSMMYCVFLIMCTILSTYFCCGVGNMIQTLFLVEYIFSIAVFIIYNSKFSKFSFKLSEIDINLRINVRHYFNDKKMIFVCAIILWIIRIGYITIHCLYYTCFTNVVLFVTSILLNFALDMFRVLRFSILNIIRYRLQLLHKRLEEFPGCKGYFYVNRNKAIKENKIKFCTKLYGRIADILDLISPEVNASMFVSIFCSIPKLIINTYHLLLVIEGREPMGSAGFTIMNTSQVCFLLFSPCIMVELLAVEVSNIKLYLHHRLLEESGAIFLDKNITFVTSKMLVVSNNIIISIDPQVKEDLEEFLQYTGIRNFQCKIWRVIPMNAALLIEVTNICTSSVLVAINFTHLYG